MLDTHIQCPLEALDMVVLEIDGSRNVKVGKEPMDVAENAVSALVIGTDGVSGSKHGLSLGDPTSVTPKSLTTGACLSGPRSSGITSFTSPM
jgi:hypothetical protein